MTIYEVFQAVFSSVSEMLLYPVLVLLFAALAVSLWCAGRSLGRWVSETVLRRRAAAHAQTGAARGDDVREAMGNLSLARRLSALRGMTRMLQPRPEPRGSPSEGAAPEAGTAQPVSTGRADGRPDEADVEFWLQREEQGIMRPVERLRMMTRIAPALGLMGTLIPMCGALSALMDGKLEKVAGNLIVAFGTTIVGLASACICFVLLYIEQQRASAEMRRLEYEADKLMARKGDSR